MAVTYYTVSKKGRLEAYVFPKEPSYEDLRHNTHELFSRDAALDLARSRAEVASKESPKDFTLSKYLWGLLHDAKSVIKSADKKAHVAR